MIQQFGRVFAVGALCLTIGLQWIALQSIAWTSMLVQNVRQTSLTEAVAKTFDGDHPCQLCKGIQKQQSSQKKSEVRTAPAKPDLICSTRSFRVVRPFDSFLYPNVAMATAARALAPPVPPPRSFLHC